MTLLSSGFIILSVKSLSYNPRLALLQLPHKHKYPMSSSLKKSPSSSSVVRLHEPLLLMGCKTKPLFIFLSLIFFAFFLYYFVSFSVISPPHIAIAFFPANISAPSSINATANLSDHVVQEQVNELSLQTRHVFRDYAKLKSDSVLFPDWDVLAVVSPETPSDSVDGWFCFFSTKENSKARFSGFLPLTNLTTFKCNMPKRVRRQRPIFQPVLTKHPDKEEEEESLIREASARELIRNNFYVYEALSSETDVALFGKGVNGRQGFNRPPHELRCLFGDNGTDTAVRTAVTSSAQEVFRCAQPDLTLFPSSNNNPIKVSIEIPNENLILPSVVYYTPRRKTAETSEKKSLLCASTMVYNVGKYLKEWVMYHSRIGVEKFILYDNDSDDDLGTVVQELNEQGFNVTTFLWLWPKTQEAGFSHNALYLKDSCKWMMYFDVDEFLFSPSWFKEPQPSPHLLQSLLPKNPSVGEVSFQCHDFGPSGQTSHPAGGVTQGYTCYRRVQQQRHKSIVLLEAVDESLNNVIHHFGLKTTYKWKQMSSKFAVVNHYKYQAWSEFKSKFRRRVSAYVVD
ncbi:glycosyltransferase family 92 protein RCOM_0530710-like [Mangifera indica]|uniref:glycosyltransferase family 92 protein RCOM_0530710-like n=1 Tax=Mangifera indica TaxID=29780 RepID=UPI001CFA2B2E|nr:glycosyltransferase family 92 protein RCOM_0530710-like [Mangifera indica]